MIAHIPSRQLDKSTTYRIQRETLRRGVNILRCVNNGCEEPRLPPFTTCRICRGLSWKQGAQKAARMRKRMSKARSGGE
jgi:hypothetical protein